MQIWAFHLDIYGFKYETKKKNPKKGLIFCPNQKIFLLIKILSEPDPSIRISMYLLLISELMHFYLPSLFYLKSLSILSVFKSFENLIFLIHCTKAISNFLSMWPNQFKPYSITISNNKLQYSQLFFLLYED